MKKFLVVLFALTLAVALSGDVFAKNGLPAGFGLGLKPNLNNLGDTIMDDGLDGAEAHVVYGKAIIDEKTLLVLDELGVVKDVETNGAMSGLDFAINVRYDFMGYFFGRTGFDYYTKISGGETTWKYDAGAGGLNGMKASQKWESSGWAIPLLAGINLPALDGKVNLYAGLGIAIASATWSVEIDSPQAAYGVAALGNAKEKVEFDATAVAPMYVIGLDAQVVENVNIFVEWETILAADYSDVEDVKTPMGQAGLGTTKIAYPVVIGGSIIRLGAQYNIGTPWM